MRASLRVLSLLAVFASAGACGGKVTVDESSGGAGTGATGSGASGTGASGTGASGTGASGTGGSGAGTSTGTSTVTATSTGTGVGVCDCELFCEEILDCGFEPPGGCLSICDQVPQQAKDCVCAASSCQEMAQECLQGGGGGPGGGPLEQCFNCINDVGIFGCEPAIDQCLSNPSCESLIDCNSQCGWTPPCAGQCAAQNPAGALDFANLMECVSCGSCIGQCAQTPLGNYCLDG